MSETELDMLRKRVKTLEYEVQELKYRFKDVEHRQDDQEEEQERLTDTEAFFDGNHILLDLVAGYLIGRLCSASARPRMELSDFAKMLNDRLGEFSKEFEESEPTKRGSDFSRARIEEMAGQVITRLRK